MKPVTFLAFDREFVGVGNTAGARCIAPGLREGRSAINYHPSTISSLELLVYNLDLPVEIWPMKSSGCVSSESSDAARADRQ